MKPEFWTDYRLSRMPSLTRLVFACLWSMADDEGRGEGDASTVQRFGFPMETTADVAAALDSLAADERIALYQVRDIPHWQVVNFRRHQRIDKPQPSRLPPPPGWRPPPPSAEEGETTAGWEASAIARGALPDGADTRAMSLFRDYKMSRGVDGFAAFVKQLGVWDDKKIDVKTAMDWLRMNPSSHAYQATDALGPAARTTRGQRARGALDSFRKKDKE